MDKKIAEILLDIKAIFMRPDEPFTWASGIKSPIYCDNRLILTETDKRKIVENYLAKTIKKEFPDCEVLMGTSTAGIPHAAFVAEKLSLPMGYVRTSNKDHGRENKIEGKLKKNAKVVVVEDLISTGGSVIEVVNTLKEYGADVLGITSIFTYNMQKSIEAFNDQNIKVISLTNIDVVASVASKKGYIKKEDIKKILKFRDNPSDESWMNHA